MLVNDTEGVEVELHHVRHQLLWSKQSPSGAHSA